jgi:hypothetical protein
MQIVFVNLYELFESQGSCAGDGASQAISWLSAGYDNNGKPTANKR